MATRAEHARALAMEKRLAKDEQSLSMTVKMPESVRAAIYARAKAEGTSASQWAREALVMALSDSASLDEYRAKLDAVGAEYRAEMDAITAEAESVVAKSERYICHMFAYAGAMAKGRMDVEQFSDDDEFI